MNKWAISFPNLGITFNHVGKTVTVFGIDIAYYGITIVIAMIVGILIAESEAKRTGQDSVCNYFFNNRSKNLLCYIFMGFV